MSRTTVFIVYEPKMTLNRIRSISMSALLKMTMKNGKIGAQWFQLHRAILTMVTLLTITAFILIFVEKKAWPTFDKSVQHAIMGCIVTAFCLINPIMGNWF